MIEDCNGINAKSKSIETQIKELTKKREQVLKKQGPEADVSKFVKDLGDLALNYEELKLAGFKKQETMKAIATEYTTTQKDDLRKMFVHFVSQLKNIEYDVNAELEVRQIFKSLEVRQRRIEDRRPPAVF